MDMLIQFDAVLRDRQERKAEADWAMYLKTWETQSSHERFLHCLLAEAFTFNQNLRSHPCYATRIANIRKLRRVVRDLMRDPEEDKYVDALREIAQHRLFELPLAMDVEKKAAVVEAEFQSGPPAVSAAAGGADVVVQPATASG